MLSLLFDMVCLKLMEFWSFTKLMEELKLFMLIESSQRP